jgi:hypothetical protein
LSDLRDQWAAAVIGDRAIPGAVVRVAWALREFANRNATTTVSTVTIAKMIGADRRHVRRYLKLLEQRGYLVRFDRGGNGYGRSHTKRTQLAIPGGLLDIKTGAEDALALDKKTGAISGGKGGNPGQKGGQPMPPKPYEPYKPGADARASEAARSAPIKNPLVCAIALLTGKPPHGIPWSDAEIAQRCDTTPEQVAELRRASSAVAAA